MYNRYISKLTQSNIWMIIIYNIQITNTDMLFLIGVYNIQNTENKTKTQLEPYSKLPEYNCNTIRKQQSNMSDTQHKDKIHTNKTKNQ